MDNDRQPSVSDCADAMHEEYAWLGPEKSLASLPANAHGNTHKPTSVLVRPPFEGNMGSGPHVFNNFNDTKGEYEGPMPEEKVNKDIAGIQNALNSHSHNVAELPCRLPLRPETQEAEQHFTQSNGTGNVLDAGVQFLSPGAPQRPTCSEISERELTSSAFDQRTTALGLPGSGRIHPDPAGAHIPSVQATGSYMPKGPQAAVPGHLRPTYAARSPQPVKTQDSWANTPQAQATNPASCWSQRIAKSLHGPGNPLKTQHIHHQPLLVPYGISTPWIGNPLKTQGIDHQPVLVPYGISTPWTGNSFPYQNSALENIGSSPLAINHPKPQARFGAMTRPLASTGHTGVPGLPLHDVYVPEKRDGTKNQPGNKVKSQAMHSRLAGNNRNHPGIAHIPKPWTALESSPSPMPATASQPATQPIEVTNGSSHFAAFGPSKPMSSNVAGSSKLIPDRSIPAKWSEETKWIAASAAHDSLLSNAENAEKSISSTEIYDILNQGPSYEDFCMILETKDLVFNRTRLAQDLVRADSQQKLKNKQLQATIGSLNRRTESMKGRSNKTQLSDDADDHFHYGLQAWKSYASQQDTNYETHDADLLKRYCEEMESLASVHGCNLDNSNRGNMKPGANQQSGAAVTPQMMAQYWTQMQQYFRTMQQQIAAVNREQLGMMGMKPALHQQTHQVQLNAAGATGSSRSSARLRAGMERLKGIRDSAVKQHGQAEDKRGGYHSDSDDTFVGDPFEDENEWDMVEDALEIRRA